MESATEKQKRLIQAEIAKLSGAISRHGGPSRPPTYPTNQRNHPYAPRGASTRGRGRGRGRGGSYALDLRQSKPAPPSASTATPVLPTAVASSSTREDGEVSPEPPSMSAVTKGKAKETAEELDKEDWVKKTSKGGNMSLMTVKKSNVLAAQPRMPRRSRAPAQIQILNSSAGPSGPNRVVIDGVIFQFEEGGTKLTRVGELAATTSPNGTPTRKSVAYGGQKYRRTSKGNLVSSDRRAAKAGMPCRYFTKTGRCNRALTCPFTHDPARVAICPKFLRSNCPHTASSCPLSHIPSPHNTPSCIHFQATASCRNGDSCIYPHVKVADTAPVCEQFARGGWCDKSPGTCPELHVWECGEWRSKGICSKGGKCGLRHVLSAENGKGSEKEAEKDGLGVDQELFTDTKGVPVEGGFEEQNEFIEFDHGTPADPESSGTESEEGDDEVGAESSEGDEDEEMSDHTETDKEIENGKHLASSSPHSGLTEDQDEDEDAVLGIVM